MNLVSGDSKDLGDVATNFGFHRVEAIPSAHQGAAMKNLVSNFKRSLNWQLYDIDTRSFECQIFTQMNRDQVLNSGQQMLVYQTIEP